MNSVNLVGRLTRDPEMRYLQSGTAVTKFSIAIDKGLSKEKKQEMESQNKPTADFINIVTWGKTAEFAGTYLAKGLLVGINGRLESGSYEKDGIRRYTTDVNCNNITMIEWKEKQDDNIPVGFEEASNDEIPF